MTCGALFTCCVALALLVRRSWRWRRIEVVRDTIKTFASTRSVFTKGVKLVILDEADAMTNDAQAALRRVMEKYVALSPTLLVCGGGWVVVVVTHSAGVWWRVSGCCEHRARVIFSAVTAMPLVLRHATTFSASV
jgi:hypothetical protein